LHKKQIRPVGLLALALEAAIAAAMKKWLKSSTELQEAEDPERTLIAKAQRCN
jgi:hypothetical protein